MAKYLNILNMPKKKKKHTLVKIFICFIILIVILIITSPLIVIYSSPFIVKKIWNRDLNFEKIKYSPIKGQISLENLSLSTPDGISLISIKKLFIDLDLKKTLCLRPTISSILIDSPKTYIEKKSANSFQLPPYLNTKPKKTIYPVFNLPFAIEQIELKNGSLKLKEGKKYKDLLSDLSIFIPGINTLEKNETYPIIKGKLAGKEFNLKGKTIIDNKSLTNQFNLTLKNFNINEVAPYIPDIKKIKIISGLIDAKIKITFITYKNKKPLLIIDGNANLKDLFLKDIWTNMPFLKNVDGNIIVNRFDVFNKLLEIEKISMTKGKLSLSYSNKSKESSTFFIKKKKKSTFKTYIKSFKTNNLNVLFLDKINNHTYEFYNSEIYIKNFSNHLVKNVDYTLKANAKGLKYIKSIGNFNLKEKSIVFDDLLINNLETKNFKILPSKIKEIEKGNIKKFEGKIEIGPKKFSITGKGVIENILIAFKNSSNKFTIKKIDLNIEEFDPYKKILSIQSLNCYNAGILLNKEEIQLQNLNFNLPQKKSPYIFQIELNENIKKINIHDNFFITNIAGNYYSSKKEFDFQINNINLSPKINIILHTPLKIEANGKIEINNISIYDKKSPVLKLEKITGIIDKFKLFPFYLNLSEIIIDSPYFVMTVKEDKKLYLFSIFEIKTKKSKKKTALNIDNIKFKEGRINFKDYSLYSPFKIFISDLNGEIRNFPSTVHREGTLVIDGIINNRNNISIDAIIGPSVGIKGKLKSNDLFLPQFSQYSEKYTSYAFRNGFLNINAPFDINEDNLNIEINMTLKDFRITKLNSSKSLKTDLSKIIPLLEDNQGKIKINLPPIKGKWGKPDIDFRSIFFDLFLDILSNSGKNLMPQFSKFKPDDTIEIIYFKSGKPDFLLDKNKIFSKKMLNKFNDKNKYFLIEGYVDKQKDSIFIKEEILKEKILIHTTNLLDENSPEEILILKKIYLSMTGAPLQKNINRDQLRPLILQNIIIEESRYYALSYARIKEIRNILINEYNIDPQRIGISEKSIYENPYISGIGNSIAAIKSGAASGL